KNKKKFGLDKQAFLCYNVGMKKYIVSTAVVVLAVLVFTCAYFLIAPKTSVAAFKITPAEESNNYATTSLVGDLTLQDAQGVTLTTNAPNFKNPWLFCEYYTDSTMVVDVVCLNYADYQAFTPDTYAETLALFDKITAYFFKESKQHLTMKFNISIAQSSETTETAFKKERNATYDRIMFERHKQNSSEVLTNYGEAKAWLIIHSSKKPPKDGAINSPHTSISIIDVPFVSINSGAALSTYLHELYHTLGLFDLYTGNIYDFVGLADIMSTSTHTEASAYYKKQLGWLEESAYSDGATTDIETIDQNGVYTLSAPSAVGKTTAYKFGERNGEFFLAEMRTFPDGAKYLTVQRINTAYLSNIGAKDQSQTAVLAFGTSQYYFMRSTGLLSPGDTVGSDSNILFYSDGTRARFCINAIQKSGDEMSFNFYIFEESLAEFDGSDNSTESIPAVRDIYVVVLLQSGDYGFATRLWLYNSVRGEYEEVESASRVYIAGVPYYKVSGVQSHHTKCKLAVSQYRVQEVAEVALGASDRYTVQTQHNFLHDIGDFVNDAAAAVYDLFHTAWRMIFSE
ncbi:MAG: hypothetical protein IJA22_01440, partial [Clostridia bacterium]|nr:hypothetical protein [Clostridia bacterium]